MAKHRVSRSIVALSASAIAAVYAAGYVHTEAADAAIAAGESPTAIAQVIPSPVPTASPFNVNPRRRGAVAPPTPVPRSAPIASASASTGASYKDGVFTGSGDSRRGGFDVQVTVQGGQITDVKLTRAWTQYPASRIAALPNQVIARQSAQVDRVSGATYSAAAFRTAVQQALAKAQAA